MINGIIGDLHLPGVRPGYLDFCTDTFEKYKVDQIIAIGDIVDWHSISFHTSEPQCPGPKDEFKLAKAEVQKWKRRFPKLKWCIGNHDELPARVAKSVSLPEFILKSYNELWDVPDWEVDFSFVIDEVLYKHGSGCSGIHPAWNLMNKMKMSAVMGHTHARAGTKWSMNPLKRFFCLDVGCGISEREWQFAYGRDMLERPILACGIVDDGQPISVAMKCSRGEKYHDSRFENPHKSKLKYAGRVVTKKMNEKNPVHYNEPTLMSTTFACGVRGGSICFSSSKKDVTCGNCRRTKAFKEVK
ncbi:hypothetical protein LCGC14_1396880 [marine sediment metagenome]|uniref:Calcineurin-like phosphoesterase domain-containing protein n=1 Tax=marine sediment metagenome TaxID=412755 RepID=A0A0F9KJA5_9ZZZZ|nr:metallophosphoesterase [Pricia sp.]